MSDKNAPDQKPNIACPDLISELTKLCYKAIREERYVGHAVFKELTTEQLTELVQTLNLKFNPQNVEVVPSLICPGGKFVRILQMQPLDVFDAFKKACEICEEITTGNKGEPLPLPLKISSNHFFSISDLEFFSLFWELKVMLKTLSVNYSKPRDVGYIYITKEDYKITNAGLYGSMPNDAVKFPLPGISKETPFWLDLDVKRRLSEHLSAGLPLELFMYRAMVLDSATQASLEPMLESINAALTPYVFKWGIKNDGNGMQRILVIDLPSATRMKFKKVDVDAPESDLDRTDPSATADNWKPSDGYIEKPDVSEEGSLQINPPKADRETFIRGVNNLSSELDYYLLGGDKPKSMETFRRLVPTKAPVDNPHAIAFYVNGVSKNQCMVLCDLLTAGGWKNTLTSLNGELMLILEL